MDSLGKYVYCIIRCAEERAFCEAVPVGSGVGPVHTVTHGGLAAVVSDSPVTEYEGTRANMLAHERVQEGVMRAFTLLPVRFGTVAAPPSPVASVGRLLETRGKEFEQLLSEMEGKAELGIKALWRDEGAAYAEILAKTPDLRRLRDSLAGKPPEATHFQRVRLGEMVHSALERERGNEASRLLAPLRQIACRTVENQVVVDRMIANAAFLVDKGREGAFDQAVRELDAELGKRVVIRYVGPTPPYNFVNIVVNWGELGNGSSS